MREYKPQANRQKKAAYNDRFYVSPTLPKDDVSLYPEFKAVVDELSKNVEVIEAYIETNQLVVYINYMDNYKSIEILRDNCGFDMLVEMSALDYLEKDGEFEVFYLMLNLNKAKRLRLKMRITQYQSVQSIYDLFKSSDWAEREMFDMFGIVSNNHPNLKRVLLPYDWEGHPLRKSYPLQGDEFAHWYEVDKIFGKDQRDVIGPEIRDAGMVDRYDSKRFARLGKEVAFGADPEVEDLAQSNLVHDYNKNNILVEDFKSEPKILVKRR